MDRSRQSSHRDTPHVAEHLEILRVVRRGSIGVGFIESVSEADAFNRILLHAVYHLRLHNATSLQNGRNDIDHVVELVANTAGVVDVARP